MPRQSSACGKLDRRTPAPLGQAALEELGENPHRLSRDCAWARREHPITTLEPEIIASLSGTGAHEYALRDHFEGRVAFESAQPAINKPLVVLCFENRSGSNYLASLLRTSGKIHGLGEALNADTVIKRATNWEVNSFPEYFQRFVKSDKPEVGVKASWDQLLMLFRFGIHTMFDGFKLIYVRRERSVAQAVSRHIAFQTGKWTSETKVAEAIEPEFDTANIALHLHAIQHSNQMFESIFQILDLDVHRVTYERLVFRPNQSARNVMKFLGHDLPDWKAKDDVRMKRQSNALNDAFVDRFREEMKTMILAGPTEMEPPAEPETPHEDP